MFLFSESVNKLEKPQYLIANGWYVCPLNLCDLVHFVANLTITQSSVFTRKFIFLSLFLAFMLAMWQILSSKRRTRRKCQKKNIYTPTEKIIEYKINSDGLLASTGAYKRCWFMFCMMMPYTQIPKSVCYCITINRENIYISHFLNLFGNILKICCFLLPLFYLVFPLRCKQNNIKITQPNFIKMNATCTTQKKWKIWKIHAFGLM